VANPNDINDIAKNSDTISHLKKEELNIKGQNAKKLSNKLFIQMWLNTPTLWVGN